MSFSKLFQQYSFYHSPIIIEIFGREINLKCPKILGMVEHTEIESVCFPPCKGGDHPCSPVPLKQNTLIIYKRIQKLFLRW